MSYPYPNDNDNENSGKNERQPGQGYGSADSPYSPQTSNVPDPPHSASSFQSHADYSSPNPSTSNSEPSSHPQPAPMSGFKVFGLSWTKNIVPNPSPTGMVAQKSTGVAYALWLFLGFLGVHQFYLGNNARGLFNLTLWGLATIITSVGIPVLLVYIVYWVYEAATLSEQTTEINAGYIRKSIL